MRWVRLSSLILAAVLAGCGLSHYQEQMLEQQNRLQQIEDEDRFLDEPLKLSDKKDRPAYFFRPPQGIASQGTPHESSGVLERFPPRQSTHAYFQELGFGVERMKPEDFWSSLLRSFPNRKVEDAREVLKNTASRGPLRLKELRSEDGLSYGYVWSDGSVHAAVVFRLIRANDEAIRRMDVSLGTLAVGSDAKRLEDAYKKSKEYARQEAARRKKEAERD